MKIIKQLAYSGSWGLYYHFKDRKYHAGCRVLSRDKALVHWSRVRGCTRHESDHPLVIPDHIVANCDACADRRRRAEAFISAILKFKEPRPRKRKQAVAVKKKARRRKTRA